MCEYCEKNTNNKPIMSIDKDTDKSKLSLVRTNWTGYTIYAELDNLADDSNNVPDIVDQFFQINYCPMCGRKLLKEE